MISINDYVINKEEFPDKTMKIVNDSFIEILKRDNNFTFTWTWEDESETMFLYYLVSHFKTHCKKNSNFYLVMPYIPNARMDRVNSKTEVFTLKYFCNFINSLEFDKVYVMDAHSNVSLALLNNVEQMGIIPIIRYIYTVFKPDVFFFPDEGSYKRYSKYIEENLFKKGNIAKECVYTFANKQRCWNTGRIEDLNIVNPDIVRGKRVLIVDDICSYGGTFLRAAKALKNAGANEIALYVTHCENSILKGDFIKSGLVKKIYTTNSILKEVHPLIEKVSHYKIP